VRRAPEPEPAQKNIDNSRQKSGPAQRPGARAPLAPTCCLAPPSRATCRAWDWSSRP